MSSDESTGTQISTVSNRDDGTKTKLKSHKSEQWEINLIGNFVLGLYHRSFVSANNEWLIKKSIIREEYNKFITKDLRKKLNELNGSSDIGTLLHRCGFLLNTPRGNPFFKIKYSSLFDFRNNKIKELDKLKINSDGLEQKTDTVKSPESLLLELVDNISNVLQEDNLEVDESMDPIPLEYQASLMQLSKENYNPTNMSCCICEEDFSTMDAYEEHIQKHGDDTDFEFLNTMSKFDNPIFKMSYRLCKNSHYFCFEFETKLENLIIDRIIIVQSRSFYYVHNMRVPYKCPENGKDRFFVDSHLFTIHVEQPIVLICHLESNKETHIVEQHHFMRSEEFPKVNFSINPYRLPDKKIFKPKFQLADYYPPKEIQDALKDDFYYEKLMKTSNEFRDYVRNGKTLQPHNIGASINILLQIEDMDTIQQYLQLTQKNIKLRSYGDEYSFQLKPKQRVFIENILSAYDEVILTTRTDILAKSEDIMQLMLQNKSDINRMKNTFVGLIQAVNTGRISFKCDKKINIHGSYTIICRPSRLNFRYQYRSLELLPIAMDFLKKFLFPSKIMPRPLSRVSLDLYNKNISGEQLQAVRNIAEGPRNDATYIVFGPPGTGKTTTIVESILQLLKKPNTKILVTASSNSACDEVALRLCKYLKQLDIPRAMVRIYSRSSEIRTETIDDELLENSNMYNRQFYPDIEVLHEYRIVVCTLSVLAKLATGKFGRQENGATLYTHLFIDEVAASMEAEALIGITTVLTPKSCLIISGDHKQLGPILQSKRAKELGLDVSLMDRLLDRDCYRVDVDTGDYDRTIQTRLIRNYRSHPAIVNLYSGLYYNHSLESFAKKDDVSSCELWHKSRNKQYPIIFHAIYEPSHSDYQSHSLYNLRELEVVMDYVKDLMYFGINGKPVQESDIGIISPYKKQYRRIQEELNIRKWFGIETGSVETFQGKEKDIIIVSFVRSGTRNLGFLDNPRRLNVTISRPKSILIMVGNPQTLSLNSDFEYIIKECQRNNTFVGGIGPPRGFAGGAGGAEAKKENTTKADDDLLKLLNDNMKALSVENKNGAKEEQKTTKNSRKSRGRKRGGRKSNNKNKISNENKDTTVDDKDEDDDDDDDEAEEEDDDEEGVTASDKLRNAISQALIANGSAVDDDMESVDLNEMTEEEGRKLDEALANAFKALKKTNGGGSQTKKSKSYRVKTTTVMHFRIRVLDLIEIYLQQKPSLLISIEIMLALFNMLEYCVGDELKPLQTKVEKVLTKLTSHKNYTTDEELKEDNFVDFIRLIVEKKAPAVVYEIVNKMRNKCTCFLIANASKINADENTDKILKLCQEYTEEFIKSRNPTVNITLLSDIFKLRWRNVWNMAEDLTQHGLSVQTRTFRRIQIYEVLSVLYKNHELQKQNVELTKKHFKKIEKSLSNHLKALGENTSVKHSPKEFQTLLDLLLNAEKTHQRLKLQSVLTAESTLNSVQNLRKLIRLESAQIYQRFCNTFKLEVIRNTEVQNKSKAQQQVSESESENDDETNGDEQETKSESKAQKRKSAAKDLRKQKKQKKQQRLEAASRGLNGGIGFTQRNAKKVNSLVENGDSDEN